MAYNGKTTQRNYFLRMHCPDRPKYKTTDRFGNLMELYEKNYMQLRLLIPALKQGPATTAVSHVSGCLTLYMQMTEQNPYTSTLRLTYRFLNADGTGGRASVEPDLYIRVYHDARSAEVLSGLLHGQQHVLRTTRGLTDSWKLNRFLYKWLRYLLFRGHRFELCSETRNWICEKPGNAAVVRKSVSLPFD